MYLDLVIVIALILFAVCWFRSFSKSVYAFAIIDIFLRLLHYIAQNLHIKEFTRWVNNIFPKSIPAIIETYSKGVVYTILIWVYIVIMVFFLGYTIRTFIRKK